MNYLEKVVTNKEYVIDTMIRVYKCYNEGTITESEKDQYIEILESFMDEYKQDHTAIGHRFDAKTSIANEIDNIIREKLGDEETNFYILTPGHADVNKNNITVYIPDKNSISTCLIITNTKNNSFILSVLKSKKVKFTTIHKPEKEILKDWSKVCNDFHNR